MKKSIRVLSVILALSMMLGILSVFGSAASVAYPQYKGTAIRNQYNDIDKPVLTTDQYGAMALDYVDRILLEQNIKLDKDTIYVGSIDITSVNATFSSVTALVASADQLLPLLGDAGRLNIDDLWLNPEATTGKVAKQRPTAQNPGNQRDVEMAAALIGFVNTNIELVKDFVKGSFSLGFLDSVIPDIDVNLLLRGLLYGIIDDDFDSDDDEVPAKYVNDHGLDYLAEDLLIWAMLGDFNVDSTGAPYALTVDQNGNRVHEGLIWAYFVKLARADQEKMINDLKIVSTNKNAYAAIEDILVDAFNYVAVPELNNVTRPWLRELCGIKYVQEKMDPKSSLYVEGYDGEPYDAADLDQQLAPIFDLDGMRIPEYKPSEIPAKYHVNADDTFINNLNNFLGYALTLVLSVPQVDSNADYINNYVWEYTGNASLLTNIANVAKFVLNKSGDKFFADYIDLPESYTAMDPQAVYAFVIRAIFNGSVDWMYIEDDCNTLADVLYEAAYQMAWQDIPECEYTKPTMAECGNNLATYNEALLNAGLNIMMDIAVYNLNKVFDCVPAANIGVSPANQEATSTKYIGKNGLLHYADDWEAIGVQIAVWGVHNYGAFLTANGASLSAVGQLVDVNNDGTVGTTDAADVWEGIDYVLNALIPISSTIEARKGTAGEAVWLYGEIAEENNNGQSDVVRSLIFDYLALPLLNLDATNIAKIFMKNDNGAFADNTIKGVLIKLVTRVINAIFPGTITSSYAELDDILSNAELGDIAGNLIASFYTYIYEWLDVALPIVCEVLELSTAQEFEQMDSMMGSIYSASQLSAGQSFTIVNGSSGINTSYVNDLGTRTQDGLYVYELNLANDKTFVKAGNKTGAITITNTKTGNTLEGGDTANVAISGNFSNGDVIQVTITYKVKVEDGSYLNGGQELSCTRFAYVGSTDKDDSEIRSAYPTGTAGFNLYAAPSVYSTGSLGTIANYAVQVERLASVGQNGSGDHYSKYATISVDNTNAPFIEVDTTKNVVETQFAGNADGSNSKSTTSGTSPLKVADGYVALSERYTKASVTGDGYSQIKFNSKNEFVLIDGEGFKKVETKNEAGEVTNTDYIPVFVEDAENDGQYVEATAYDANTKYYQFVAGSYVNNNGTICKKDGSNYYPLYVMNEYRFYEPVAADADFDATKTYYTFSTNVAYDNAQGKFDAEGKKIIEPGTYSFTISMSVDGFGAPATATVYAIIYNDYGLPSLYNNAANSNLQEADLTGSYTAAWNNYTAALDAAAKLALAPKTVATYNVNASTSTIKSSNENYNYSKFAELYDQLADAKEAVEKFKATAGVDTLVTIREQNVQDNSYYIYYANGQYSLSEGGPAITLKDGEQAGWNYIEYYETAEDNSVGRDYCFYNYRNFVPHYYEFYRTALNKAEGLINKRTAYPPVEPVFADGANAYEYSKYLEERDAYEVQLAAYEEAKANPVAIDPVDVAYASHMLTLAGSRILPLEAHKDALEKAIAKFGNISNDSYSTKTWSAYTTARDFANKVVAADYETTPNEVRVALSELVEAAKKLNKGIDTTALANALEVLKAMYLEDNQDATQARVDSDLFVRTLNAVSDAENIIASDLSFSTSNQERVANALAEINTLMGLLEPQSGSTEVTGLGNTKDQYCYANGEEPEDCSYAFHSTAYSYWYYPVVTNFLTADEVPEDSETGMETFYTDQGFAPVNYIVGIGNDQGGWDCVDMITIPDGYTAVWNPDDENGAFGTTSYISIYDSNDEEIDRIYVVVYGDINGDGMITGDDTAIIDQVYASEEDLLWGHDYDTVYLLKAIAADVFGTFDYLMGDNQFAIDTAAGGNADLLQVLDYTGASDNVIYFE